jgi:glutaredoxin-related protein
MLAGRAFARTFSAASAASAREAAFAKKAVDLYKQTAAMVDMSMKTTLEKSKLVLFMEGTADAPKSAASLNVIKMLTAAQAVPVTVVDTTAHPAILGYTCAKSGKGVGPHLYKDGVFMGDHDAILRMHSAGSLTGKLGSTPTLTTGVFEGELPIGTF